MDDIKREDQEDLWGYAKRLRFVRTTITEAFPGRRSTDLRLLDIGCGNGSQLTLPLAQAGFQTTGIDTDERSINHARRLSADLPTASFRRATAADLSREMPFDIVILSEILEHSREPEKLLKEGVACMSPDGLMIVTVPNGYGEFEIDSWIFRSLRLQKLVDAMARGQKEVIGSTDNQQCGHVQFFTRAQVNKLFEKCALAPFREGTASFLAGPIAGHLLGRFTQFIEWNARVTDSLPLWLASAWYFALRRRDYHARGTAAEP